MSGANTPSIQARLLRRTLATVLLWSVISAIAAAVAVSFQMRTSMESTLEEAAQALVILAEHEVEVEAISHGRAMPAPPHQEVLQWQLRASTGRLVARSHSAPEEPWPAAPLVEGHQRAGDFAIYTIPGQDLWLQVAVPLAELHRAQYTAAVAAGGTVLALGLIACVILAWRSGTNFVRSRTSHGRSNRSARTPLPCPLRSSREANWCAPTASWAPCWAGCRRS